MVVVRVRWWDVHIDVGERRWCTGRMIRDERQGSKFKARKLISNTVTFAWYPADDHPKVVLDGEGANPSNDGLRIAVPGGSGAQARTECLIVGIDCRAGASNFADPFLNRIDDCQRLLEQNRLFNVFGGAPDGEGVRVPLLHSLQARQSMGEYEDSILEALRPGWYDCTGESEDVCS